MTSSARIVLGLLALSLVGLAATGSSLYVRLAFLWGIVLMGSWIWAQAALRGVRVERRARTLRAQVGDIFEERFRIQNTGRLPRLWLEVSDRSAMYGSHGSRVLSTVEGEHERSYLARARLIRRGVFTLGPTVLASGDPFGLFPINRTIHSDKSLLVYPMVVDLHVFPGPQGLLPGGEALRRRTHEVTPNAAGVREYAPGDPWHRIHWKSTARRDRLMVKEFELDPLTDVWIFIDAEKDVQVGLLQSSPPTSTELLWQPAEEGALLPCTEEYAATIAASLGQYFLRRKRAVGLVSQGRSLNVLLPDRGERHFEKMLEALALLRAEGNLSIAALSTTQTKNLLRGSTVILITPSVRQEVAFAADILLKRGLQVMAVLLDAASFGGPPGTTELAQALGLLGVPTYRVENDANVAAALSGSAP
jgi:uncharacterized protein (DUF58 family)